MLSLLLSVKKKKNQPKKPTTTKTPYFQNTWVLYVSREPSIFIALKTTSTYVHTKLFSRNEYFKEKAPSFSTETGT